MTNNLTKKPPKHHLPDLRFPIRSGITNFKLERNMRIELSEGLMERFDDVLLNFSGFDLLPHSEP